MNWIFIHTYKLKITILICKIKRHEKSEFEVEMNQVHEKSKSRNWSESSPGQKVINNP